MAPIAVEEPFPSHARPPPAGSPPIRAAAPDGHRRLPRAREWHKARSCPARPPRGGRSVEPERLTDDLDPKALRRKSVHETYLDLPASFFGLCVALASTSVWGPTRLHRQLWPGNLRLLHRGHHQRPASPPTEAVDANGDGCDDLYVATADTQTSFSIEVWLGVLVTLAVSCGRSSLEGSQPASNGQCPAGFTPCGRGEGLRCYDLASSQDHCGSCRQACPQGIACEAGACRQYHCEGTLGFEVLTFASFLVPDFWPALGDFDGDGNLDFVGVADGNGRISLIYGTGTGTFTRGPVIASTFGQDYWRALVADLDQDGLADLISIETNYPCTSSSNSTVTVRPGSGDRSAPFKEATTYPTSTNPSRLLLADFDDDGLQDLVVRVGPSLEYWPGQLGGRFEHQVPTGSVSSCPPDSPGLDLLVGTDWNGDGALDLVYSADGSLHYRLGRADGSFESEVDCALAAGPIGDLDHDNRPDLITYPSTGNNLLMLGIDGCHANQIVPLPNWPSLPGAFVDFDGDGNLDFIADSDAGLTVRTGDGKGGFAQPISLPKLTSYRAGTSVFLPADLNRDGKLDFILSRADGWGVFLNTCE